MGYEVILSTLGALLSIVAATGSMYKVFRKRGAEQELEKRWVKHLSSEGAQTRARRLAKFQALADVLARNPYDEKAAREAIEAIEAIVRTMDKSDRKQILPALRQPSRTGRAAYAQKVIRESLDSAARSLEPALETASA